MLVSKIGDSLAVRVSANDVERLRLKEGDEVELEVRRVGKSARTALNANEVVRR